MCKARSGWGRQSGIDMVFIAQKLAGFSESATNNPLSEPRLSLEVKSLVIQCREILAVINSPLSERHLSLELNSQVIQCRKRVSCVHIDRQPPIVPPHTHTHNLAHN